MSELSQAAIGNLESGIRGYGASILKISKALGVTPAYLNGESTLSAERMAKQPEEASSSESEQLALLFNELPQDRVLRARALVAATTALLNFFPKD